MCIVVMVFVAFAFAQGFTAYAILCSMIIHSIRAIKNIICHKRRTYVFHTRDEMLQQPKTVEGGRWHDHVEHFWV